MKHQEITYRELAKRLNQSESSIKRAFSKEAVSIRKLDEICKAIGTDVFQLVAKHQ